MCFYLSVFHQQNITILLKYMCRIYFHETTKGKSNQKIEKTHNYPSVPKITHLVTRAMVAVRKKIKLVKVKPQH